MHFVSLYQSIITQTQTHGEERRYFCHNVTSSQSVRRLWKEEQLYFPDMFWSLGFSKVEEHVAGQWGFSFAVK